MDICFSNQQEFLKSAYNFYRARTFCYDILFHREEVIEWLYKLGRDYNVLNIDYTEFRNILREEHNNYWCGRYRNRKGFGGKYSHYCEPEYYRVLEGFTYNRQTKKNQPTKNDWWTQKGLLKTRHKVNWSCRWKKNLKHFCKRKHRQFERQAIKAERYDELHCRTYKQSEDPWRWD